MRCVWVIILVSSCLAAFMMSLIFLRGPSEHCQSLDYRVSGFNKENEEVARPLIGGQEQVGVPQVHHQSQIAKEAPARADVALASVPEPKRAGRHVVT